jgi:hypothetical protein
MGRGRLVAVCCALAGPAAAGPEPHAALEAPTIAAREPHAFAALPVQGAAVRVAWSPVVGAARYQATWTDPRGRAIDVETSTSAFERAGVGPGHYTLAIAAIDMSGAVGPRSAAVGVDVVELRATPPGSSVSAGPTRGAYAVGTRFLAPGLHCELGTIELDALARGKPSNELRATAAGAYHLRCANPTGAIATDTPVIIAPVVLGVRDPAVERGRTSVVHVEVASVAELGAGLDVTAHGDVELSEPQRTADGFDVPVTVAPGARTATLAVVASGLELGQTELRVVEPAAVAAPAGSEVAWWAADVGGQIGAFLPASSGLGAPGIGHPTDIRDTVTSGPLFGPRFGLFPTRRVGVELEASVIAAGYEDKGGVATLLAPRAQLAIRAFDHGRLGVRLIAGAGEIFALQDFGTSHRGGSGEVHYGAAWTVETRPNLWLRVQGLDVISTAASGGYAHSIELQLAIVTRLGRRDRW